MNADYNSAIAAPINMMIAISEKDSKALAIALKSGAAEDAEAREILIACLTGADAQREIVNVRGRGQRFAKYPFDASKLEGGLSAGAIETSVLGLEARSIDIRKAKLSRGRPTVFWSKPISDGSLIEDFALEWAAANLEVSGTEIVVKRGAWTAGIDAFIAYSRRYISITASDAPAQVDQKENRYEDLRRGGKAALAAWRRFKARANQD